MISNSYIRFIRLFLFCVLIPFVIGSGWYIFSQRTYTEIHFRHALNGFLEKTLQEIVADFNKDSPYKVVLEYGGNYTESFYKTFSEKDRSKRPHLLMVSEYNTLTIFRQKGDYIPLYDLINVEEANFVPVIKAFYSFKEPRSNKISLYSLPFNCSTAILFYNKDIFKKAGLPNRAPETWEEMEIYAAKLLAAGYTAFTTAWPAAYLLEHFSVVHNIPFATEKNGFSGDSPKLLINTKPYVDQLNKFVEWASKGYYVYSGRMSEKAEEKFIKQECAMLLQGANRLSFVSGKGFEIGVGTYPYWGKMMPKGPYALNIGGTSIWILAGHYSYKGVEKFLNYLASEKIQQRWHETTGYLPTTMHAYERTKRGAFYAKNPAAKAAVEQVLERKQQDLPNGVRIENYAIARERILNAIDQVLTNAGPFYAKNPAAYMAVKQVIERTNQDIPNGLRISNYGPAREKIIDGIEAILDKGHTAQDALNIAVEEAQIIIDGN